MKLRPLHAIVPLAAFLAWKAAGPSTAAYSRLDASAEPLRTSFNADVGKVRVLMLVAPT